MFGPSSHPGHRWRRCDLGLPGSIRFVAAFPGDSRRPSAARSRRPPFRSEPELTRRLIASPIPAWPPAVQVPGHARFRPASAQTPTRTRPVPASTSARIHRIQAPTLVQAAPAQTPASARANPIQVPTLVRIGPIPAPALVRADSVQRPAPVRGPPIQAPVPVPVGSRQGSTAARIHPVLVRASGWIYRPALPWTHASPRRLSQPLSSHRTLPARPMAHSRTSNWYRQPRGSSHLPAFGRGLRQGLRRRPPSQQGRRGQTDQRFCSAVVEHVSPASRHRPGRRAAGPPPRRRRRPEVNPASPSPAAWPERTGPPDSARGDRFRTS